MLEKSKVTKQLASKAAWSNGRSVKFSMICVPYPFFANASALPRLYPFSHNWSTPRTAVNKLKLLPLLHLAASKQFIGRFEWWNPIDFNKCLSGPRRKRQSNRNETTSCHCVHLFWWAHWIDGTKRLGWAPKPCKPHNRHGPLLLWTVKRHTICSHKTTLISSSTSFLFHPKTISVFSSRQLVCLSFHF